MFYSMVFVAILSFIFKFKHFIIVLLNIELMMLSLLMCIFIYMNFLSDYFIILIFMLVSVCESILGLVLLILMVRVEGNDYMMFFNLF